MNAARARLCAALMLAPLATGAAGKSGTTGAAFLKITPGARAAAMGEAFTAVADDATAVHWNPAGLATLIKPEITATHSQWLKSSGHDFMAAALPTRYGTFGLGIISFSVSDIEKRATDTDAPDGVFESRDAAYQAAWGQNLGEALSVGGSVILIRQSLDGQTAGGMALTLGGLWRTPIPPVTVGLALRNLGGEIKFVDEGDPLPMTAAVGVAYHALNDRLAVAADVRIPNEGALSEGVGVEYNHPLFKDGRGRLRAGYNSAAAEADKGTGLSMGLGLDFNRWGVDVTWAPYGALGDTFRYGFRVSF